MPLFGRKKTKASPPPPGTREHAAWLAEAERALGVAEPVAPATPATPATTTASASVPPVPQRAPLTQRLSAPRMLVDPPVGYDATPIVADGEALDSQARAAYEAEREQRAAQEWAALRTGLPLHTCQLPHHRRAEHFTHWEIIWYAGEDGQMCGSYRCLRCYPALAARAYGAQHGAHGAQGAQGQSVNQERNRR